MQRKRTITTLCTLFAGCFLVGAASARESQPTCGDKSSGPGPIVDSSDPFGEAGDASQASSSAGDETNDDSSNPSDEPGDSSDDGASSAPAHDEGIVSSENADAELEVPSGQGDSPDFSPFDDPATEEEIVLENDTVAHAPTNHLFAEDRTRTIHHSGWLRMYEKNLGDIETKCRAMGYRITGLDMPYWGMGMYDYYGTGPKWEAICVSNTDELYRESWSVFQGTAYELFVHCSNTQETVVEIEVLPGELMDKWAQDVRFVAITVAKGSGPGQHPSTMPVTLTTSAHLVELFKQGYRPIDLERVEHHYPGSHWDTFDGLSIVRYNAVLIQNVGTNYREWWWWIGHTLPELQQLADEQGAHLIDIEYLRDSIDYDQLSETPALGVAYALEPSELPQGVVWEKDVTLTSMGLRLIDKESIHAMLGGYENHWPYPDALPVHHVAGGMLTADTF